MNSSQLSILRPWDILGYSGDTVLCDTIRVLEIEKAEGRDGKELQGIVDGLTQRRNQRDPIHSATVAGSFSLANPLRYEMTAPCARQCSLLPDLSELVAIYRIPWLQPETNPDCAQMLRDALEAYWQSVIGKAYGYLDLVAFNFLRRPLNEKHLVCSETVIDGIEKCVDSDPRFSCIFPDFFKVAGPNNVEEVGNVSPYDIHEWANNMGFVIWEI